MQILEKLHPEQKVPIHSWAEDMEDGAMRQVVNLSQLEIAFHHIAIMPDVHQGYGMPIGGVLATIDYVVPNAVGVDIGCGMRAYRTSLRSAETQVKLADILSQIRARIPMGFAHHRQKQSNQLFFRAPSIPVIERELASAKGQIGTLGGGNHFIEILRDDEDLVWLMLHSGSRNFGYQIAKEYHHKAKDWCDRSGIRLPDRDLAYLPIDSQAGSEYLEAMHYAQDFAFENRRLMMQRVKEIMGLHFPRFAGKEGLEIDVHHNYATWEEHFGKKVLVHRKGAINADQDVWVIVPGSMATASYIGRGLGSEDSFCSSAHGAGRSMGRKEAKRKIRAEDVYFKLDKAGIRIQKLKRGDVAEEWSAAYKNINQVMEAQKDLIKIEYQLQPMGVTLA